MSEYAELRTPQASEVAEAIPKDVGVSADVNPATLQGDLATKAETTSTDLEDILDTTDDAEDAPEDRPEAPSEAPETEPKEVQAKFGLAPETWLGLKATALCGNQETAEAPAAPEAAQGFFNDTRALISEGAVVPSDTARNFAVSGPGNVSIRADVRHTQGEAEEPAKQASGVEIRIDVDAAAGEQQTRSVLYKVTEASDGLHAAKTLPAANDSAITETKPASSGELSQCMGFLQGMRHYEQTEGQQLVSDEPGAEAGQHRLTGELEQQHPEIAPLPPTPMTREASARLESWGVSPERVRDLRDLTSSMRYDLCPQKAERIAQTGGYLQETDEGVQEVVLPHFYDSTARLDGQCADIAIRYHELLYTSGYLEEVNQELADKGQPPLERAHIVGLSRTHFNQPGQTHIWTGLMPKGAGINELLTTDASFQEISMTANNGYTVAQLYHNPPTFSGVRTAKAFAVKSEGSLSDFSHTAVLGMSSDRQLSFGLGFYRQESTGEVRPVINALPGYVNGPEDKAYCTLSNSGEVTFVNGARLSGQQKREMHDIASGFHMLALIPDADKAEAARQHRITIKLR